MKRREEEKERQREEDKRELREWAERYRAENPERSEPRYWGSGTGSLTFTVPQIANVTAVAGIDQAEVYEVYVAHARARNSAGCADRACATRLLRQPA